jgi:hypothetical protein
MMFSIPVFISCDADFSPYSEFQEKYSLTCILRSDTTFQTAILSHNYLADQPDPNSYTNDPSIVGADVRVWYNDSVYVLSDSSETRTDSSRYKEPFRYYYNNHFIINPNEEIEIEVLLPNGRRLYSFSVTPKDIIFSDGSDVIIPPVNSDFVNFIWLASEQGAYFSPKFEIKYLQVVNGIQVLKTIEVPIKYVTRNGNLTPLYPEASNRTNIVYSMESIALTLEKIAEGDPDKQNYSVFQTPLFKLLAFDAALSRYTSSTSQSLDDLTVTLNTADYTNINGGFGIFGSYIKKNYSSIKFQQNFIESFGYNFIFDGN